MPEIRLSGVQKPCSLRAGNTEKRPAPRAAERGRNLLVERFSRFVKSRNGARRSRFQSRGAARGRVALTRAGTRAASDELRSEIGPASTPEKAPDVRNLVLPFPAMSPRPRVRGKPPPGSVFQRNGDVADAERPQKTRGGRGVATTPAFCPNEPRARMDAGRANSPPPHLAARSSRKRATAGGAGRLRLREKTPPRLRGAPLRVRPGAEAERPCPEGRRNARRKTPERGTKKSGRTPPPATESGRAPSVKTTQLRTT